MLIVNFPPPSIPEGNVGSVYPILSGTLWEHLFRIRLVDITGQAIITAPQPRIVRPIDRHLKAAWDTSEIEANSKNLLIIKPERITFNKGGKYGSSRFLHLLVPRVDTSSPVAVLSEADLPAYASINGDMCHRHLWKDGEQASLEQWLILHGETTDIHREDTAFLVIVRSGRGEIFIQNSLKPISTGMCIAIDPGERFLLAGEELELDTLTISGQTVARMAKSHHN